jgi:hypothetical protein
MGDDAWGAVRPPRSAGDGPLCLTVQPVHGRRSDRALRHQLSRSPIPLQVLYLMTILVSGLKSTRDFAAHKSELNLLEVSRAVARIFVPYAQASVATNPRVVHPEICGRIVVDTVIVQEEGRVRRRCCRRSTGSRISEGRTSPSEEI